VSRSASIVIVSPALAAANNGNWRTARRWQELLTGRHEVRITRTWPDAEAEAEGDAIMLALHARRSAASIAAWSRAHPDRGLAVVLTGTDLYQDILTDAGAQRSLALAQRLVVLQACAPEALPPGQRSKARVIYQSAPAQAPLPKPTDHVEAVMVGHLRAVKAPEVLWAAARALAGHADIRIAHIGDGEGQPALAEEARRTANACPGYAWLGGVPHEETLQRIRAAHVLVHTSMLEGGAHVILEAVRCGTPVLATRIPGNVGMLGEDYLGYFPVGDGTALADRLLACRAGQQAEDPSAGLLARLAAQCALRGPLFDPQAERAALLSLLQELEVPA
jgi:putative glycosyltransferase (TIGR04348 family)